MFLKTLAGLAIALASSGLATAEVKTDANTNFCTTATQPEGGTCKTLKLFNQSGVSAKAVNVIQQPNEAGCTKDDRRFTKNIPDQRILQIKVNTACKYKVRFKTKSRCSGDSTAYMTARKFAENKNTVFLKGKCTNLKTEVGYYKY